jgi:hypothetical protein
LFTIQVVSNLGGGSFGGVSAGGGGGTGGRQLFNPPNPSAVMFASLLEIFYDPMFKKFTLFADLQWNKESRIQVLLQTFEKYG